MQVKMVKGLSWNAAAIGNATWSGVKLRDVLKDVGINEDSEGYIHVQVNLNRLKNFGPIIFSSKVWMLIQPVNLTELLYHFGKQ